MVQLCWWCLANVVDGVSYHLDGGLAAYISSRNQSIHVIRCCCCCCCACLSLRLSASQSRSLSSSVSQIRVARLSENRTKRLICPIFELFVRFLNLEFEQADLIILRIRTRLLFANQCCKDFTAIRVNRWSVFYFHVRFCRIFLKFVSDSHLEYLAPLSQTLIFHPQPPSLSDSQGFRFSTAQLISFSGYKTLNPQLRRLSSSAS